MEHKFEVTTYIGAKIVTVENTVMNYNVIDEINFNAALVTKQSFTLWNGNLQYDGYIVSIRGARLDLWGLDTETFKAVFQALYDSCNGSNIMGVWFDDKYVYVDVNLHFYFLNAAIKAAKTFNQLAIWDIEAQQAITIE